MDLIHEKAIIMEVPYMWHIHLLIGVTMQVIRQVTLKYVDVLCHEIIRMATTITDIIPQGHSPTHHPVSPCMGR